MNRLRPLLVLLSALAVGLNAEPVSLHPANPHYYLFDGKPAVLITSAEHYGATRATMAYSHAGVQ